MKKYPVTTRHFTPELADAARNKALELASNDEERLFMLEPYIYLVMNSAAYTKPSRRVIKQFRKGNPFA